MGNAQHLATTGEWYTSARWADASREVLGRIDLDPCTNQLANEVVKASRILTAEDGGLSKTWSLYGSTAFVNPPGTCERGLLLYKRCGNLKRCSCGLPKKFLTKCLQATEMAMSCIYLAYSVNQLRQLSKLEVPVHTHVMIAMPADRIPFLDPATMQPVSGTNCDSAFICMSRDPELMLRFARVFRREGCAVYERSAGY